MISAESRCTEAVAPSKDYHQSVGLDESQRYSYIKSSRVMKFGKNSQAVDSEITYKVQQPVEWEHDVRLLISSKKWLVNFGLRKNRLQLQQILQALGFKSATEYDPSLKKPISSKYGGGLFQQIMLPNGQVFNVSCTREELLQLEKRLQQALYLLRRRMEWLTTESRRLFGVIEEKAVTIVLDIRNMSPQQFDQYKTALERVLREQVSHLSKFNLIRASSDIPCFLPECVQVSHDTIEKAIKWVWSLDRLASVSNTSATEAVLKATRDLNNEAVYLFSEGTSIDCGREILREKVVDGKFTIPIHVISFNCDSSDTIKFFQAFVKSTKGKFHAYAVVMELDAYEVQPEGEMSRANIMLKRKTFGGIPPGAGVREDVMLIFEEMEEARNSLAKVRMLLKKTPESNIAVKDPGTPRARAANDKGEEYLTSVEWLTAYGLSASKLDLHDVLSGVAFKHHDGVVDIMQKPANNYQTDAVLKQRLVNAQYCRQFPIVRWRDGRVVHVQVTPDVYRTYEEKMMVALNKFQQRIDWLNKGSRSLFGTIVEEQIYILIDSSASMQQSLSFVKKKLHVLLQEQLRHKRKVNFVTFGSKASAWKDRLVEVSERSLQSAWAWIESLSSWGTSNAYAAIQMALGDPQVEAIYLLTDGRPNQPPKSIISQVSMHREIPIHTISFNCEDKEANQFLFDLSEATGGRFHYFNESGPPREQPDAYESKDIQILKDEIVKGLDNLQKLANLRDECVKISWKKETDSLRKSLETDSLRKSLETDSLRKSLETSRESKTTKSVLPAVETSSRPSSAPPTRSPIPDYSPRHTPTPPSRPTSAHGPRVTQCDGSPRISRRPKTARLSLPKKPLVAGHTRTSLLRTLNSSGRFSPDEWLLPETKKLFEIQVERQKHVIKVKEKQDKVMSNRSRKLAKASEMSSKQWLKQNGLDAKHLTILDALGSTFVPHKAKYVSILDKNVMAKVFDDIFPIAHVSRKQNVSLINPNGVNLREYERKLLQQIEKYKQRLNNLIWKALPQVAKEEFESDGPVSFEDNKAKLLYHLEQAGWPVKESDIQMLFCEIQRAEKFFSQSQALRKAASGESEVDGNEEQEDYELSFFSPRSQKSSKSQREVSPPSSNRSDHNTPPPQPRERNSSDKSDHMPTPRIELGDDNEVPEEAIEPEVEEEVEEAGLGQVVKSTEKIAKGRIKESAHVIRHRVRLKLDTLRNQKVVARRDDDGLYYPAVVLKCPDPRHASVRYDSGAVSLILTRNIIPTSGAIARPVLYVGDYVLMRVVNLDSNHECYVPAVVQIGPQSQEVNIKFYTLLMYNGQRASTLRTHLIKISKERFELASKYIWTVQNESREEAEQNIYVSPRREIKEGKRLKHTHVERKQKDNLKAPRRHRETNKSNGKRAKPELLLRERSRSSSSGASTEGLRQSSRRSRSPSSEGSRSRSITPQRLRSQPISPERSKSRSRSRESSRSRSGSRGSSKTLSRSRERSRSRSTSSQRSPSNSGNHSESIDNSRSDYNNDVGNQPIKENLQKIEENASESDGYQSNDSGSSRQKNKGDREEIIKTKHAVSKTNSSVNNSLGDSSSEQDDDVYRSNRSESSQASSVIENSEQEKGSKSRIENTTETDVDVEKIRNLKKNKKRRKENAIKYEKASSELDQKQRELLKLQEQLLEQQRHQDKQKLKIKKKIQALASREEEMRQLQNTEQFEMKQSTHALARSQHENKLQAGEEVLARWSDDGWYYRGIIHLNNGDGSYNVEDSTGFVERIWRKDIYSENDDNEKVFELDEHVIALHPEYSFSYCPGNIVAVRDSELDVVLYDGSETTLPWGEVYHSNPEKHKFDVQYIITKEDQLIGAAVVARDDRNGAFYPGSVVRKEKGASGIDYVIRWADGHVSTQTAVHIFSAFTRRPPLTIGDRVLALADSIHLQFLPGHIVRSLNDHLVVKFCNGEIVETVDSSFCYWLGQPYFNAAVKYYRTHDPSYY